MSDSLFQYEWHIYGQRNNWQCELEDCDLIVWSELDGLFSFSVCRKDGRILRTEYDFSDVESAKESAEKRWKIILESSPRRYSEGQWFEWYSIVRESGSECVIGLDNSIVLETNCDDATGLWSSHAYFRDVILMAERGFETLLEAQAAAEAWYKENSLQLLRIHTLNSMSDPV